MSSWQIASTKPIHDQTDIDTACCRLAEGISDAIANRIISV